MSTILAFILIGLYFIPTFIAANKKNNTPAILINFFFGWSLLGWIVAFIWALSLKKEEKQFVYTCDRCGYKQTYNQQLKFIKCQACGMEQEIKNN